MEYYSKILFEAYEKFILPLGGKKVPTPYRMNDIGAFQKVGPAFQGKSSPEILIKTTKQLAKEQGFDLKKANVEQIKNFMVLNKLGIDCSGFVYRILNELVQKVKGKPLTEFGLPNVGRTNVTKLTSFEFTITIETAGQIQSGDLIELNSSSKPPHCFIVLQNDGHKIIYAHSAGRSKITGVHTGEIIISDPKKGLDEQNWKEEFKALVFNAKSGDGARRLKCL